MKWDWRGAAAFVLALGLAMAIVAGFLAAELTPGPITTEEVSLISTLGGAAIGAVATYLGTGRPPGGSSMTTETPPTPEPQPEPQPEPEPTPAPPDEESEQQQQQEPVPPESEEEEVDAMTGGEDPADL